MSNVSLTLEDSFKSIMKTYELKITTRLLVDRDKPMNSVMDYGYG